MNRILLALLYAGSLALAQPASQAPALRAVMEGRPWGVQVMAPGFEVQRNVVQPDGRVYLLAKRGAFVLSIMLEKIRGAASDDGCVKAFAARGKARGAFQPAEVVQSRLGDMPTLEYLIAEAGGVPVRQKNLLGCLAKDDVYADIHLSKVGYEPADREEMLAILRSASVVAADPSARPPQRNGSSFELTAAGSRFFQRREYGEAIANYQSALELEKTEQKLPTTLWRVLIDNLAMAYGLSGKESEAEEVLKYGISKDPTYPMFYYVMANVWGERNELNKAMEYLRLALANKKNVNAGEKLPDPLRDDSFQRFRENREFRELAARFR